MNKKEILQELKEKFGKEKVRLGFEPSFEEIEEIFFIQDAILKDGFVSEKFSRQLCSRICELFLNWEQYLHSLIIPNTQNLINMNESKVFQEGDRKEILKSMSKLMALVDKNNLVGLTKIEIDEKDFINESVKFWKEEFKPLLIKINKKVLENWEKKDEEEIVKYKGYI
jgi:hypothetical protein